MYLGYDTLVNILHMFKCVCLSSAPQSKVIQNSAKDTEGSLGSNFYLLIISKVRYSPTVNFTNVSLSVPKVTGSLAVTLFSFYSAKDLPPFFSIEEQCLPLTHLRAFQMFTELIMFLFWFYNELIESLTWFFADYHWIPANTWSGWFGFSEHFFSHAHSFSSLKVEPLC